MIVATNVSLFPAFRINSFLFNSTDSIGTGFLVTVTSQIAVLSLVVVTVIMAVPGCLATIVPFWSTVATLGLLDFHVNSFESVVSLGLIVALNNCDVPSSRETAVRFKATFVISLITVTLHVSLIPLLVVTVIVTVPGFLAVNTPVELTVTTSLSLDVHVNFLSSVVLLGLIVAFKELDVSFFITNSFWFNFTPTIGICSSLIVTLLVALKPLAVFTVIVASPSDTPVTIPLLSIAAILGLLEIHVNCVLSAIVYGDKIATYLDESLTFNVSSTLSKFIPVVINVKAYAFLLIYRCASESAITEATTLGEFEKIRLPIWPDWIVSGKVTLLKFIQSANTVSPIVFTPLGSTTVSSLSQYLNKLVGILVKFFESFTSSRLLQ